MNEYKEDLIKIVETISQDYLDHSYRYGPVRSDLKIITGIKRNTNCVRSFGLHVQHLYEDKIRTLDKLDL